MTRQVPPAAVLRISDIKRRASASPRIGSWLYAASVFFVLAVFGSSIADAAETAQRGGATGEGAPMTLADAVQVLAREQSAAEQYAVFLDRLGKKDPARYVQGITRYAEAKADFDGLIEALKIDLIEGRDPNSSATFKDALQVAAQKRVTFTTFVADQIVGGDQGARASLPKVPGLSELIQAVTEAGISIWREYRSAGKQRRDEIRDQLDHLKWRAFGDIAKT